MTKTFAKYFIAIVPEGDVQQEATAIKHELLIHFNLKYALKSPAHITLKMPFRWNEKKEEVLIHKLEEFFKSYIPFDLDFAGVGRFGKRVIFIKVISSDTLLSLQSSLAKFCKTKLNQITELSDSAYHPHMTLAFKDLKEARFKEYYDFLKPLKFEKSISVQKIVLLKRIERRWEIFHALKLKKS